MIISSIFRSNFQPLFLLVFWLLACTSANAQSISPEEKKILGLIDQGDSCQNSQQAKEFYLSALERSESINFYDGQIRAHTKLGLLDFQAKAYTASLKDGSRAIRIADESGDPTLGIVGAHNLMSMALAKLGALSDAIHHRKQSLSWQRTYPDKVRDEHAVLYSLSAIGTLYLELEQNDSALHYFYQALEELDKKASRLSGNIHNNLGIAYTNMGENSSAVEQFQLALEDYKSVAKLSTQDTFMITMIKGNMAVSLPDDSPIKKELFEQDIETSLMFHHYSYAVAALNDYSDYLIRLGNLDKAEKILNESQEIFMKESIQDPDLEIELHGLFTELYIMKGNRSHALVAYQTQTKLQNKYYGKQAHDKLVAAHTSYELDKIESELIIEKMEGEKSQAEIEILNREKELSHLQLVSWIFGSVLVVIALTLFILFYRSQAKRKAKEKELRNRLLRLELEYSSDRLNRSVLSLGRKKEFAEELMNRISEIKDIDLHEKMSLRLFVLNELEIDEEIISQEKEIHDLGEELISKLKMRHPKLTGNDIKLLGYIKMNLTNKQIAEIKNISPQSVKIAKNRLRKKLNIDSGASFSAVLSI